MSVKEKLLEKIETMTSSDLEWLSSVLEAHEYPDIRVDYGKSKRLERMGSTFPMLLVNKDVAEIQADLEQAEMTINEMDTLFVELWHRAT